MSLLKLDLTNAIDFIKEDLGDYQEKVTSIHNQIHNKTGRGSDFLGWIDLPNQTLDKNLVKIAQELRQNTDVLVVVGIGGSYLGAKAGIEFLSKPFIKDEKEVIFAGHHLSGSYLKGLVNYLKDKRFAINVISKSGTTTEPAIAFRVLKKLAEEKYQGEANKYIVATTDSKRGALFELASQKGYEKFIIPDDVGGRFSVLTPVGLLPFLYKGYDVLQMLNGAKKAFNDFSDSNLDNNNAYKYALSRYLLYKSGKDIEILGNYEPRLTYFSEWWKQLFGESEGKENKGLFISSVSLTTDLHSMGQYIQEGKRHLFETIINVNNVSDDIVLTKEVEDLDGLNYLAGKTLFEVNQQALKGTMLAHVEGDVPNILINIKDLSEETFGYLVYFFEIATAMSAYLLDVNPFNQPGVEAYKTKMFALLGKKGYEDILK